MSTSIDMKTMAALQAKADAAFSAWKLSGSYALKNHTGYVAALKSNTAATSAYEALRAYADSIFKQLQQDPDTDGSWFQKIGGIRDGATQSLNLLASVKGQLIADMATHLKLAFPPSIAGQFGTPEAAAAALDDKNKRGSPNPNAADPGAQDPSLPPVDGPPPGETPWGLYAAGAAAVALVLKIVRVW